jgi:hypothetical protein
MIDNFGDMQTRRDFITKVFRVTTLAIVAGTSGYLLLRNESDEVCNFDFVCKNCKNLKKCKLPEAKEFNKKNRNLQIDGRF